MLFNFLHYQKNIAIITEQGNAITYKQLDSCCDNFVKNIEKRSLILFLCGNDLGSLIGYVAAIKHQHVPLMLDENIDVNQLYDYISRYQPDLVYLPYSRHSEIDGELLLIEQNYALMRVGSNRINMHKNLALLLTTSGSTGSPKCVRQSYTNISANTDAIINYLSITASEIAITSLPMHYTYGLSIINTHLCAGASIVLTKTTIMQREFWLKMMVHNVTSLSGVPFTYAMLKKLRFMRMILPTLKTLTQAGGKLSPELHREFAEYAQSSQKSFIAMYGAAEATARMSYLPADKAIDKCGSIGVPIPGGKFVIVNEHGKEIDQPNKIGELVYFGDNVVLGYAENGTDLEKGDVFKGCLYSGDMVQRDSEGYYYVVGRKKRFLKVFGNRIGLDEVEIKLRDTFPDLDCACNGVDDMMYIFITDETMSAQVKSYLVQQTRLNHTAFKIVILSHIPKNSAGKTLYSQLESYYDAI